MKLYALKHQEGYLKDSPEGPVSVELNKASVYKEHTSKKLKDLKKKAEREGFEEIRLIELTIIEKDPYREPPGPKTSCPEA
ncbi:MAG: hypothetical protein D5R97_02895 [Candidatus Syntrophonatronum acetioxidans]|uniref:Uncharacterized protein n=1 Tax=Candidatus Syntrophonatronum acetioxidans TaxID=1795816 RepID=A0A424YGS4_9FIRM|nr:MAG: hypothetical protein D5R97_02895 [Candidatus Syntrophonatronum acetioxidans]